MPDEKPVAPRHPVAPDLIRILGRSRRLMVAASTVAAAAVLIGFVAQAGWIRLICGLVVAVWILLLGRRSTQPAPAAPSALQTNDIGRQRLDLIDGVVAELARRPWDPTLVPSVRRRLQGAVLLLPGASYHLPEMVALAAEWERRGRRAVIGSGAAHFERNRDGLSWYPDLDVVLIDDELAVDGLQAVVTMKDWEGYGAVVARAKSGGIPTLAKVEGAQDFDDLETPGHPRRPYRSADHILCQGDNDFNALEGMDREIVGSTRLERLRWAPPTHGPIPLAVVNYNFSYGVLAEIARDWLSSATTALRHSDISYVVSAHPSVRLSTNLHPSTSIPISRLLTQATVLVSRFSTVPFEAMARGVPFIYHNPHDERMPTFHHPEGAFEISYDQTSLVTSLGGLPEPGETTRAVTDPFFRRQVSIIDDRPAELRTADVLERIIEP